MSQRAFARIGAAVLMLGCASCYDPAGNANTANFRYEVTTRNTLACGKQIVGVKIENAEKETRQTQARVELLFVFANGTRSRITFPIGDLAPGQSWEQALDPLRRVHSVEIQYITDQGTSKTTLDVSEPETFSETERESFQESGREFLEGLGRGLAKAGHPTGTFTSSDKVTLTLADEGQAIEAKVRTEWTSAVLGATYTTSYLLRFDRKGIQSARVLDESARIPASQRNLDQFVAELRKACG